MARFQGCRRDRTRAIVASQCTTNGFHCRYDAKSVSTFQTTWGGARIMTSWSTWNGIAACTGQAAAALPEVGWRLLRFPTLLCLPSRMHEYVCAALAAIN